MDNKPLAMLCAVGTCVSLSCGSVTITSIPAGRIVGLVNTLDTGTGIRSISFQLNGPADVDIVATSGSEVVDSIVVGTFGSGASIVNIRENGGEFAAIGSVVSADLAGATRQHTVSLDVNINGDLGGVNAMDVILVDAIGTIILEQSITDPARTGSLLAEVATVSSGQLNLISGIAVAGDIRSDIITGNGDEGIIFNVTAGGSIGTALDPVVIQSEIIRGVEGAEMFADIAVPLGGASSLIGTVTTTTGDFNGSITGRSWTTLGTGSTIAGDFNGTSNIGSVGISTPVSISGDLSGDLNVDGALSGPLVIEGDVTATGSIDLGRGLVAGNSITLGGSLDGDIVTQLSSAALGDTAGDYVGIAGDIVIDADNMLANGWAGTIDVVEVSVSGGVATPTGNSVSLTGPSYEETIASAAIGGGAVGEVAYRLWRADSAPVNAGLLDDVTDDSIVASESAIVVSFQGNVADVSGGGSALTVEQTTVATNGADAGLMATDITSELTFTVVGNTIEVTPLSSFQRAGAEANSRFDFKLNGSVVCSVPGLTPPPAIADVNVVDYSFTTFGTPCNSADLAEPTSLFDLADIDMFVAAFAAGAPAADLVAPFGVVDLSDVDAFILDFLAGCPGVPGGDSGLLAGAFGALGGTSSSVMASTGSPVGPADLAAPFGVIDSQDMAAFLVGYHHQSNPVVAGLAGCPVTFGTDDCSAFAAEFAASVP